jgi:hypothetical protein
MDELSSPAAVIEITNAVRWGLKLTPRMRKVLISLVVSLVSVSSLHAQSARPAGQPPPPRARMLTSTGNKLLDGAALEAYSQWRFQPDTVSQVKIPIEFANRPKPPTAKRTLPKPAILYPLLILLGFAVAVIAMRTRRRDAR